MLPRNYRLLSLFLLISFFSSCELFYPPEFFKMVGNDKKSESTEPVKKPSPPPKYWTETFTNLGTANRHFGQSVSLSGDGKTFAVGGDDYQNTVYVNRWNGVSWDILPSISGPASAGFGSSVSLNSDGNTVGVGAYNLNSGQGQVYVYRWNISTLLWDDLTLSPTLVGENTSDFFGVSISLSGDGKTLAVGGEGYPNGSFYGKVYVYRYDGSVWQPTTASTPSDFQSGTVNDNFGYSVSLSRDGNTLAVGSYGFSSYKGRVVLFRWNGSQWVSNFSFTGNSSQDQLGYNVSLSGDGNTLAVGAVGYSASSFQGKVCVYRYNGSSWQETTASSPLIGNAIGDKFGFSVSLSDDGSNLAVGAPNYNSSQGKVFIYHWDGVIWSETTNFPGGSIENFGFGTALNGDATSLIVGANNYNVNQGKTYLFQYK